VVGCSPTEDGIHRVLLIIHANLSELGAAYCQQHVAAAEENTSSEKQHLSTLFSLTATWIVTCSGAPVAPPANWYCEVFGISRHVYSVTG